MHRTASASGSKRRLIHLLVVSLCLAVLLPSLVGTAVATDDGIADNTPIDQTAQTGFLDGLFGGDNQDDDDDGFFGSIFGSDEESFDGYPDGFSADGIEDFDQAVGTDSTHYNADSVTIDATIGTTEGEFDVTIAASGATRTAAMTSQTPDREIVNQYITGETVYIATPDEYAQEERAFTREEFYGIDDFLSELEGMDLEEDEIDGDTVIYTTTEDEEADIELAVADTGELDYLRGTADDAQIDMEFSEYDATSVDEPDWVDQAREHAEEPGDHEIESPDRDPRDTRERSAEDRREIRHTLRAQEPGEVTVAIQNGGTYTIEPGETRVTSVTPSEERVVRVSMPDRTEQFEVGANERLVLRTAAIEEPRDRRGGSDEDRQNIRYEIQPDEPGEVVVDIEGGATHTAEPGESRVTRFTPPEDRVVRVITPDRTERIEVGADERLILRYAALEETETDEREQRLQERRVELREEIQDIERRIDALESSDRGSDTDEQIRLLRETIRGHEEEIDRLEEQLADIRDATHDAADTRDDVAESDGGDSSDASELRERIEWHEEQIENAEEQIDRLEQSTDRDEQLEELWETREQKLQDLDRIEERLEQIGG